MKKLRKKRSKNAKEPRINDLAWTIAVARIIFGKDMNIQAPPNLSNGQLKKLINAGINDWGGISPLTPDFVNPEAPWPNIVDLSNITSKCKGFNGSRKILTERLAIYPYYAVKGNIWIDKSISPKVIQLSDIEGFARESFWAAGKSILPPEIYKKKSYSKKNLMQTQSDEILEKALNNFSWSEKEIEKLLISRGEDFENVCQVANYLRKIESGDIVTYTINRNINYTNICTFSISNNNKNYTN